MANVLMIRAVWQHVSQPKALSIGYTFTWTGLVTPTQSSIEANLDSVWDWWDVGDGVTAGMKGLFTNEYEMIEANGQVIKPAPGNKVIDARTGIPGTDSGDPAAPQVAVVASFRTAISSRRTRGRVYFPSPSETRVSPGGFLDSAYATDVRQRAQMLAEMVEADVGPPLVNHVVYSKAGDSTEPVTLYKVGQRVDTQRRRLTREQSYV